MQETQGKMVLRAIVKDNRDPEKMGRVRVVYPSFQGSSSEVLSDWAQVVSPFASKNKGAWFLPSAGDHVLVLLESSNLSSPVVIGSLYTDENPPPKSGRGGDSNSDGKNSVHFFRADSGNQIVLDETPGKTAVALEHASGAQQQIKENAFQAIDGNGGQLCLKGGKVALGNSAGELFDLLEQVLGALEQAASVFVSTAVGPGVLNPSALAKISEVKAKLAQMKGSLD